MHLNSNDNLFFSLFFKLYLNAWLISSDLEEGGRQEIAEIADLGVWFQSLIFLLYKMASTAGFLWELEMIKVLAQSRVHGCAQWEVVIMIIIAIL